MTVTPNVDPALLSTLRWRSIGPHRGGRVVAVAGHPTEQATFYFGACAGGVWKSDDGGTYWQNVSDGYFTSAAVGAIAVSTSDPAVIFAAWARPAREGMSPPGTGCTAPQTGDGAGHTWVWKPPSISLAFGYIPRIRTWYTSRRWEISSATARNVESSVRRTVANRGSACSSGTREAARPI